MARVMMIHPGVDQPIEVDEVSVPHHQAAGWRVTEARQEQTNTAAAKGRRRPQKGQS